ncbi:hypothetical protein BH10CHL1_BH10CHL1_47830 [soil metagenome]
MRKLTNLDITKLKHVKELPEQGLHTAQINEQLEQLPFTEIIQPTDDPADGQTADQSLPDVQPESIVTGVTGPQTALARQQVGFLLRTRI